MVSGHWKEREIREGQDGSPHASILVVKSSSFMESVCFGISFGRLVKRERIIMYSVNC